MKARQNDFAAMTPQCDFTWFSLLYSNGAALVAIPMLLLSLYAYKILDEDCGRKCVLVASLNTIVWGGILYPETVQTALQGGASVFSLSDVVMRYHEIDFLNAFRWVSEGVVYQGTSHSVYEYVPGDGKFPPELLNVLGAVLLVWLIKSCEGAVQNTAYTGCGFFLWGAAIIGSSMIPSVRYFVAIFVVAYAPYVALRHVFSLYHWVSMERFCRAVWPEFYGSGKKRR